MQSGAQGAISQLNLSLFTPIAVELFPPQRKGLALAYITQFSGPGNQLSSAFLFATGIHAPFSSSTLQCAKMHMVVPEIWELKTRLNFCQYLWEMPEALAVRPYDQLESQENLMRSERTALLRLHDEHIVFVEEPFFIDLRAACIRQYTPEDREKILATVFAATGLPVHSASHVIGVLFFGSDS